MSRTKQEQTEYNVFWVVILVACVIFLSAIIAGQYLVAVLIQIGLIAALVIAAHTQPADA